MLLRRTTRLTAAAFAAWVVLLALVGLRAAGGPIPYEAVIAGALTALAASVSAAAASGARAWRGPVVLDFPQAEAVTCEPPEAEVVREASLLRGSLGGAGYVHRKWIVFPTLAWADAAAIAAAVIVDPELEAIPAWPFVGLGLALAATVVFPARPFYYRECAGGSLVLYPAETWIRLGPPNPGLRGRRWIDQTFRSIEPDLRASPPAPPDDPATTDELVEIAEPETER